MWYSKDNGVSDEAIKFWLFLFPLRGQANMWLHSFPPNSFTNWANLSRAFLNNYFSPTTTGKSWMGIIEFSQSEGECDAQNNSLALKS